MLVTTPCATATASPGCCTLPSAGRHRHPQLLPLLLLLVGSGPTTSLCMPTLLPELSIVSVRIIELPIRYQIWLVLQSRTPSHMLDNFILATHCLPDAHFIHAAVETLGGVCAPTKTILWGTGTRGRQKAARTCTSAGMRVGCKTAAYTAKADTPAGKGVCACRHLSSTHSWMLAAECIPSAFTLTLPGLLVCCFPGMSGAHANCVYPQR